MNQPLIIVVRSANLQAADFGKTLESDISEFRGPQESRQKGVDDGGFEDVAQRDPVQETQEGFQGCLDQTWLVSGVEDLGAKLEDGGEFLGHGGLQVSSLDRSHLILREIKNLLGQQAQNCHVVFADRKTGMAGGNDFVDEGRPVVRPFLLQDRDQDEIEFVHEGLFGPELLLGARVFDDEIDNKIPNS